MNQRDTALTRRAALGGSLLLATPRIGRAAPFPDRALRLLVPYGGGGQTDIVSRVTADALQQRLGQAVVVDNRPGGAGNVAAEALVRSPADGYTMMTATMGTNSGLNALLYRNLTYDWEKDFLPIGQFCSTAHALVVHRSIPAEDFPSLVGWIRQNPGKFNFASAGVGASTHLLMEDIGGRLGLDMVHVPYRQSTQAMTDLLSGRIHARCMGLPEAETVRNVASVRALGITSAERRDAWPGVPTVAETLPGFTGLAHFGITVRTGTPPEAVARISAALNDALDDPRVKAGYERVGADIAPRNTPEDFYRVTRADAARWGSLIQRLNLVAD
ncbi:Bug family tripartite tricarboxylate transporter substrate binding protein [Roseococcus pinisoli]|uniref:Tripartite tricarboxylate transporter substrate binding protein n=1 Tax=Roseococcus pinisoli TaxID=2835040 RepID=A0ABS5QCU2_9PROT|nr:tripartite tricarboxylate transporter substrate binding protein [Roseococcus pinisoli]MBS7811504.1 tripartite tricarboxylate transporter substrate binding protein [Roseococcus pinisoli]